jgi:hypothetical protein
MKENFLAKILFSLSQSVGIIIAFADVCTLLYSLYNEHKVLELLINSVFYVSDEDSKDFMNSHE